MNNFLKKMIYLILFIWSTNLFSQEIKYKLVESEKTVTPIKSWHFLPGNKNKEVLKIAIQSDKIQWIGTSDNIDLPAGYINTLFSRAGKYLGLASLIETSKELTDDKIFKLEVFSNQGQALFSIKRKQYYDEPLPLLIISDKDGSVVMGHSAIGKLWFYNNDGSLSKEVDLFSDDEYGLERILKFDVTLSGRYIAVLANKRPASPEDADVPNPSGEPHLFFFTMGGEKVWQQNLPELSGAQAAISPDGESLIASSYSSDTKGNVSQSTIVFNRNGKKIANYNFLFRTANFSNDSKYSVIAGKKVAKCIDLQTGRLKWTHKIDRTWGIITSVSIANDAKISALLAAQNEFKDGGFIYTKPRVILLNKLGQLIQELEINETFYTPALNISADYKTITLGFKKGYQVYQIERLNIDK